MSSDPTATLPDNDEYFENENEQVIQSEEYSISDIIEDENNQVEDEDDDNTTTTTTTNTNDNIEQVTLKVKSKINMDNAKDQLQIDTMRDAFSNIFETMIHMDITSTMSAIKYHVFTVLVLIVSVYLFPKQILIFLLYLIAIVLTLIHYALPRLQICAQQSLANEQTNADKPVDSNKLEALRKKITRGKRTTSL